MSRRSVRGLFAWTSVTAAIAIAPTPAFADVMEIGPDGARWITGDLAGAPADDVPDDTPVPDEFLLRKGVVADVTAHASKIPSEYAAKIAELSRRFDLSPSLLEALVWQESRWRANSVSRAGARGLSQLMPSTARYLGVDPDDPMDNLEGGARYLREQLDRFDGDLERALAAYNAGPGRVIEAGGIPDIYETKQYVASIIGRLADHSRAEDQP